MLTATPVFTPYVGVSPGTTTVQMGSGSWPTPRGFNPGGELSYSLQVPPCDSCRSKRKELGVCPPGYYPEGKAPLPFAPLPPTPKGAKYFDPYVNEARLTGLMGLGAARWDLFTLALGLSFAGVLGYTLLRRK